MSDKIGRFKATPDMVAAHTAATALTLSTFRMLVPMALQLHHLKESPLNEDVQHGARRALYYQFDGLFFAAQSLMNLLPDDQGRDWFPWMVLRNRHARGGLPLPGWMQRLIDRNGGVVPETWSNDDVMSDKDIADERS